MRSNYDSDFWALNICARALMVSVDQLCRNKGVCTYLTGLVAQSPVKGRDEPSMILARAEVANLVLETIERRETNEALANDEMTANALEKAYARIAETVERGIERCKKARSAGGPDRA